MQSRNYILTLLATIFLFILPVHAQTGSLSLSDALGQSLEKNYGIIISRSDADIAAINNYWGNAGRFPTISFDAFSNNTYDIDNAAMTNRLGAGIGLNWTLFNGFKVNITKGKLETLQALSEGRLGVMIENTIEDVIMAYYFVLLQEEKLEVLRTVMALSQDRYDYELTRHSLGGTVTFNVLQAKNVYLSDKAQFMTQEVYLRNSMRNLNFLLGEEAARVWTFSEPFSVDSAAYSFEDLRTRMMASNQTLKNQYTNIILLQKETGLRKSVLYPSLNLATGLDDSYVNPNNNLTAYGNLRLSWNIYTGGTRKRAMDIAKINEEVGQVEIDEMEHALINELLNLYDFHNVRTALLDVANESLAAAELNMKIADEKFRSGAINSFNYRDIQLIYLNSAVRRLEAIYNLIGSRTSLTRLTGGFLTEDPAAAVPSPVL